MTSPELASVLVEFRPTAHVDVWQRGTLARPLHAAVLEQVSRISRDSADEMHRGDKRRGFTVSTLLDVSQETRALESGRTYRFRLTSLSRGGGTILDAFEPAVLPDFRLLGCRMENVGLVREDHPKVGQSSYERILRRHLAGAADGDPPRRIGFAFASPTRCEAADPSRGLFPEPDLVFHGLAEKWLRFAPEPPSAIGEVLRCAGVIAARSLRISRYTLETSPVFFRGSAGRQAFTKIGFQGVVEYVADPEADPRALLVLRALSDFAFFAGVGARTTMGMGQTRPLVEGWDMESRRSMTPRRGPPARAASSDGRE